MHLHNITPHVTYCGVNDRECDLFEGLWAIPEGVSYNSYIVRGDSATAIIDGASAGSVEGYIEHVHSVLGGKSPDYLVVNHCEPDHTGAIPALRREFPELIVVGNTKTLDMLKGFYGIENRTLTVADGEELALGGATLKFYLTPMLHWPETMMTLLIEDKVLFSGDAFGCFGVLGGAVTDESIDTTMFMNEMYRYYGCIVAKYGTFVERAAKKLSGAGFETICSTHGPVWRRTVNDVVNRYLSMARWDGEAGVTVIYGSMYGNTEALAEAFVSRLAEAGISRIAMHDASRSPMSSILADVMRFKGIVLASPTYNTEIYPPVDAVARALVSRGVSNRAVAVLGSFTWGGQAVRKLQAMFASTGVTMVGPAVEMRQAIHQAQSENLIALAANMATAVKEKS